MNSIKEEHIFYPSGTLQLEGLYAEAGGVEGAVICHPHPQMGGSMENNVVVSVITALLLSGCSTLRFNFRGVGQSEGTYDNGVGEQEDIGGAVSWLRQKGKAGLRLVGYSFGAWVSAKWLQDQNLEHPALLISPPIDVMDFNFSSLSGKICLILCAERDQYCSWKHMEDIARGLNCRCKVIPDADHFYFGKESEIIGVLNDYLSPGVRRKK